MMLYFELTSKYTLCKAVIISKSLVLNKVAEVVLFN